MDRRGKPVSTTFYYSPKLDRIEVGLPEAFAVPAEMAADGFQKVVCRSAHEVEIWSKKMADQDRRDMETAQATREIVEGPVQKMLRDNIHYLIAHAPSARQRTQARHLLKKMDLLEKRKLERLYERVTYMHQEAYEEGHG